MRKIASTEEIINEAKNGRPFILVDADDRENEGDIVIPAQFATPERIAQMAIHARGLICLAITKDRAQQLELPQMSQKNETGFATAFTVSVDAADLKGSGTSAADRAQTVAAVINPLSEAEDLTCPGHIFPLVARDGGVLVRPGHTEAAVDIARIAGLMPAGVICEILNEDGTMARLPDLLPFAEAHGLKIGTIADLIEWRRRSENLVKRVATAPFDSHYGSDFHIHIYQDLVDGAEHVALVRGAIMPDEETLVRVHQFDITADLLGYSKAHDGYVSRAMEALAAHDGPAVGIFVQDRDQESLARRIAGGRGDYAHRRSDHDYGIGAQILKDLGVGQMRLLTSSTRKMAALSGFGLEITGRTPIIDSTPILHEIARKACA